MTASPLPLLLAVILKADSVVRAGTRPSADLPRLKDPSSLCYQKSVTRHLTINPSGQSLALFRWHVR